MREDHLTKAEIRHFVEREHDEIEMKLFLHHLAVCGACYRRGGYILDLYLAGALPEPFSSIDLDLAYSRSEAPRLYAKLSRHSFGKQKALLTDIRTFRSWGLAELLCAESLSFASRAPEKALELAELGVLLSLLLGPCEPAEEAWHNQLRAYAQAHLGNARRVIGELRSAEAAFETAGRLWKNAAGMGDVLDYEAKILALQASLRRTQGRFAESLDLLELALSANRDRILRGHILENRAFTLGEQGNLSEAVGAFRAAIADADQEADPRHFYILHHNLLDTLSKAGRYEEAARLLPAVAALARRTGDELDSLRFQWIEARVLSGAGNRSGALVRFGKIRLSFLERGLVFDSALVGLELAALHLAEGEYGPVIAIAEELLNVFASEETPREMLAAFTVLCSAARSHIATIDLVEAARHALERARTFSVKR
jgi:tetratricopeptide (TPR) repeat protein